MSPLAQDVGYWLGKLILRHRISFLVAAASLAAVLTALYFQSKHQSAQIQDTALNYVLRGREFLDKGDAASAVAYFAASNRLFPSVLARGNAAWYMPPLPKAFFPHDGPLVALAYRPDGKFLMSAGGGTGAKLWDPETGKAESRLFQLEGPLTAAAFSPDGYKLVLGASNGQARVFDVSTQKAVGKLMTHNKEITSVAFSSDGRRVLTASADGRAREWNAVTGQPLPPLMEHDQPILAARFNPAGDRVLTVDKKGAVQLWDADSGNAIGKTMQVELQGSPAWYKPSAAFNPNGKGFLLAGWNGAVKFFDNRGKKAGPVVYLEGLGARAVYSPDGSQVLVSVTSGGSTGLVRVLKGRAHAPLKFKIKTDARIAVMAFSADGSRFLTGGTDGVLRVWDAQNGQAVGQHYWAGEIITAAAFDPQDRTLAAGSRDGLACLWDLAPTRKIEVSALQWNASGREHFHKIQTHTLLSPDGKQVLTYGGKVACLWDAATGKGEGGVLETGGTILRSVFNPDGSRLLTCCSNNEARLWDLSTGKCKILPHERAVYGGAFSANGRILLTGGEGKSLYLWDAESGKEKGKPRGTGFSIARVLLSGKGESLAALGWDGNLKLFTTSSRASSRSSKLTKASGGSNSARIAANLFTRWARPPPWWKPQPAKPSRSSTMAWGSRRSW